MNIHTFIDSVKKILSNDLRQYILQTEATAALLTLVFGILALVTANNAFVTVIGILLLTRSPFHIYQFVQTCRFNSSFESYMAPPQTKTTVKRLSPDNVMSQDVKNWAKLQDRPSSRYSGRLSCPEESSNTERD